MKRDSAPDEPFSVAILLAAGGSRRMGRPKLDLELGGETVFERSIRNLLASGVDRVRVVVPPGATAPLEDDRLEIVFNSDHDEGIASSIGAGLLALPESTGIVLVALADMPFVKPETIRRLVAAFGEGGAHVVYPVYRGRRGHPVVWDSGLVGELTSLEGDRGASSVIDRHRDHAREIAVEDPGVCLDIDTPEDYAAARAREESE